MRCFCGNAIDAALDSLGSVRCRPCFENPMRYQQALALLNREVPCPSPGCPQLLDLDDETSVLRCYMHGPMREVLA
jgi:hypothetical protein